MQQKILLVDDREDNLLSLETILEVDNYAFTKCSSGRQALKILLKEFDFALILMDVKMPTLNGFETAALIYEREKLKHIPIIFITANNYGEENIFKGYRSGAVDYIYKPINPELLRAKVSVFVELYEKTRQLTLQEQKLIAINKNLEDEIRERKISELKIRELNEELMQNISHLEAANQELDRFAFMASHDLQEPLRKIRMFSDLVYSRHSSVLNENGKEHLQKIQKSAGRMQTLIQDILTFSRISVIKEPFSSVNLSTLFEELRQDMKDSFVEKNAELHIDNDLPEVRVNPRLMLLLFNNLVSNALKYSRKDVPPVIRVSAEVSNTKSRKISSPSEKYCRIFVEDNGIGFDQQYVDHIFGMFKRLHHHTEYEGTGIGLTLCKKIAEVHNGTITARSKVNKGSTFIVSLPVGSSFAPLEVNTAN
ncbi:MAG TPA: ATP-binding protein [Bacteroidia bacterium]|nr:ATP-binding protein [Bacteroidia bacterium]